MRGNRRSKIATPKFEEVTKEVDIQAQKEVLCLQVEELRFGLQLKQEGVAWKQIKSKRKKQRDLLPKKSTQKCKAQNKQKKQRQEIILAQK